MINRVPSIFIAIFLLSITAAAQFRFDAWTTDKGMPQNTVGAVAQTPDGYLWFVTSDGLVRFDGVKMKVFNKNNSRELHTNRLRHLIADREGTLWIVAENAGLIRYRDGEFTAFTTANGLPTDDVVTVQQDVDGSLVFTTAVGLVITRDSGASFHLVRSRDVDTYKTYIAPSGITWEMNSEGLYATEPGKPTVAYELPFTPKPAKFDETYSFLVNVAFFEDEDGSLWFGAVGKLFRLKAGAYTAFAQADGLPASRIRSIAKDGAGDLWIGTDNSGVCKLTRERFSCFDTSNGLSSNSILQIFLDREKTLWIATENAGINKVTRQIIEPLSRAAGLAATNIYPILQSRSGEMWIGASGGLARTGGSRLTNLSVRDGLEYDYVQSLFEDSEGTLWVGSVGGLMKFRDGRFSDYTEALGIKIGEQNFFDIHQTSDGSVWVATNHGLYRHNGRVTTVFSKEDGLPGEDTRNITETRDGSLWIGTTAGAALLKDGHIVASLNEKGGLAGNFIRSIYEDHEGFVWFGTYDSGLSLLRNGKLTTINSQNGLFSDGVFAIQPDDRGNYWMSSNKGIYRVERQNLIDFADGKLLFVTSTAFGKSDGMLSTECNGGRQPSVVRAVDGRLWFPTQDGVAIVDPNVVPFNPLPPPVVVEDVLIQQKPMGLQRGTVIVQPGEGDVQINYTGLSFIKPEQMRFRYILEGLDGEWTDAANRRTAYYPYLPPGNYTFRVMASNSDNVWSETSADIVVQVLPPYYRRWWFIVLAAMAVGLTVAYFYRRRFSRIEGARRAQEDYSRRLINAHETERRRIAAELHDSIGQSLAIIKNQAVFGTNASKDLDSAKVQFEQISAQSAQAISEVREIAYNLRPYLLDRLGMTKALRSMLEKIAEIGALDIEADIDDVDSLFPPEVEISIYRVVQESLNNVLKHSEATKVEVAILRENGLVIIRIEDNGRGFVVGRHGGESQTEAGGFGLLGIAERVKMFGGTHAVESEPGKGTLIVIEIKTKTGNRWVRG